ncbi:uncharacterized protein Z520_03965 [Fonsecaea multimorphosa CBS 102226]|uniref:Uncharacterized protein n=1 Tax=Fonsecaea multimorphosa CBS 102226 TaxID=1442371 RepID=A0A0D2KAV5_9EURO|nr:uncharacterized protein Z520_03965 [Fonsecaea multimorphosa CBS 102226]KIY00280.1 hypothetical protein Z520_03965 [Fonsecaea multimorphosa CBS 102226]
MPVTWLNCQLIRSDDLPVDVVRIEYSEIEATARPTVDLNNLKDELVEDLKELASVGPGDGSLTRELSRSMVAASGSEFGGNKSAFVGSLACLERRIRVSEALGVSGVKPANFAAQCTSWRLHESSGIRSVVSFELNRKYSSMTCL